MFFWKSASFNDILFQIRGLQSVFPLLRVMYTIAAVMFDSFFVVSASTFRRFGFPYLVLGVGGSRSKERDRKSVLVLTSTYQILEWDRNNSDRNFYNVVRYFHRLPVTWLNTIWLNFFVESFGLKILSQVTTKLSQLHSNSRNKYVNSWKYHNVGYMRCMHARPHRRKDQLPLRSLRDLRSRCLCSCSTSLSKMRP